MRREPSRDRLAIMEALEAGAHKSPGSNRSASADDLRLIPCTSCALGVHRVSDFLRCAMTTGDFHQRTRLVEVRAAVV